MSQVKPIPDGYHTVTPSLIVPSTLDAIALYKLVFDAEQQMLIQHEGAVMHAEIRIGDSVIMLADGNPEWGLTTPAQLGGTAVHMYLYVEDVDTLAARALANGFEEKMPVADMFWGDRMAQVADPFGHFWTLSTHVEDLSEEEIQTRMQEFMTQAPE